VSIIDHIYYTLNMTDMIVVFTIPFFGFNIFANLASSFFFLLASIATIVFSMVGTIVLPLLAGVDVHAIVSPNYG
jgi:hypothetical protein